MFLLYIFEYIYIHNINLFSVDRRRELSSFETDFADYCQASNDFITGLPMDSVAGSAGCTRSPLGNCAFDGMLDWEEAKEKCEAVEACSGLVNSNGVFEAFSDSSVFTIYFKKGAITPIALLDLLFSYYNLFYLILSY